MNELAIIQEYSRPTLIIDRAATALSGHRTYAEVARSQRLASDAYDSVKRTLRLPNAKQAHDGLIQENARDLLSIVQGPGNVIAAEDAVTGAAGFELVGADN